MVLEDFTKFDDLVLLDDLETQLDSLAHCDRVHRGSHAAAKL
jgi:hypothetical protein